MNKLIQFRDQGCQGAKSILAEAIALSNNTKQFEAISHTAKRLLYIVPAECDNDYTKANINVYTKIAAQLSLEFALRHDILDLQHEDIVVIDEAYKSLAAELQENKCFAIIIDANKNNFESHFAISMLTNLVYLSVQNDKPLYDISINWMGDAGIDSSDIPATFLDASICTNSYYGFAFENNPEFVTRYLPHKELLDFAMGAGSKIFLTHEPAFLHDEADVLYITPWTYKDATGLKPQSHPYTFEAVRKNFENRMQIVSLVPEVKSTPINEELFAKAIYNTRLATVAFFLTK